MQRQQCKDHLENIYKNETEMCKAYNINKLTFRNRIKAGKPLEIALTAPIKPASNEKPCEDHLANRFRNVTALCQHYNTSYQKLNRRLKEGVPFALALTAEKIIPGKYKNCRRISDSYSSVSKMLYSQGLNADLDLETQKAPRTKGVNGVIGFITDFNGNQFIDNYEMCDYYNLYHSHLWSRVSHGMNQKQALTDFSIKYDFSDFCALSDACRKNGIQREYYISRIKNGMSQEDAMKEDIDFSTEIRDFRGRCFNTVREMCDYWNIEVSVFWQRINNGMSLRHALTSRHKDYVLNREITDHQGTVFDKTLDFAFYYGLKSYDIQRIAPGEERFMAAVTHRYRAGNKIGPVEIIKVLQFPYYFVKINNEERLMTIDNIAAEYRAHRDKDVNKVAIMQRDIEKLTYADIDRVSA